VTDIASSRLTRSNRCKN